MKSKESFLSGKITPIVAFCPYSETSVMPKALIESYARLINVSNYPSDRTLCANIELSSFINLTEHFLLEIMVTEQSPVQNCLPCQS